METDQIKEQINERTIEQPDEHPIIEKYNDKNDNTTANSDVTLFDNETKKTTRIQFKEECLHCTKIFKSKLTYEKHILQQFCYNNDEITYCKVCCITLPNHSHYKKHLFTIDHLNNIGYNKIERLQTKEVSQVHLADPYLNSNDVNKIANTNLGDSFTFVFNIGNTKTISLVNNSNSNSNSNTNSNSNNIQTNESIHQSHESQILNDSTKKNNLNTLSNILELNTNTNPNTNTNTNPNSNPNTISNSNTSVEPTSRQQKLILVLEKHINDKIIPGDSGKLFYKMLDTKLQIEDYKSLNTIINNLNIPNNYKETYLKVIEIFISMLVKEKTKGDKLYREKDISEIVINLTS
jgi:hypothetical protein